MRKVRYDSPDKITTNKYIVVPSVAVICAGGFLHESAAVLWFGKPKVAEPYILLSFEARSSLTRDITDFNFYADANRYWPDGNYDADPILAYMRPCGSATNWWSGENLWVSVGWLEQMRARLNTPICNRIAMVFELVAEVRNA